MSTQVRDPMFILYVHDMDRALAFYRDVFELAVLQHTPGWSMLQLPGATLALHILSKQSGEGVCQHAGLSLQVSELDHAIEAVLSGGGQHLVTREPTNFVPVRMCEVKDPEGNVFELRQFVAEGVDLTSTQTQAD